MSQALAAEVRGVLERIDLLTRHLAGAVNAGIGLLPAEVQGVVVQDWDRAMRAQSQAYGELTGPLGAPGEPMAIGQGVLDWVTNVGNPCAAAGDSVTLEVLKTDNHWRGLTADAYFEVRARQEKALEAINDEYVTHITAALATVNGTVTTYWWTIAGVVAAFAGELAAVVIEAATVVAIPVAVLTLVALVGTAVAGPMLARSVAQGSIRQAVAEIRQGNRGIFAAGWPVGAW